MVDILLFTDPQIPHHVIPSLHHQDHPKNYPMTPRYSHPQRRRSPVNAQDSPRDLVCTRTWCLVKFSSLSIFLSLCRPSRNDSSQCQIVGRFRGIRSVWDYCEQCGVSGLVQLLQQVEPMPWLLLQSFSFPILLNQEFRNLPREVCIFAFDIRHLVREMR